MAQLRSRLYKARWNNAVWRVWVRGCIGWVDQSAKWITRDTVAVMNGKGARWLHASIE